MCPSTDEKNDRTAELISDQELLRTKLVFDERDAEYHRVSNERLSSRAVKLDPAGMRLLTRSGSKAPKGI